MSNPRLKFQFADLNAIETILPMMREFYLHEDLAFDEAMAREALKGILNNSSFGWVFLIIVEEQIAGYTALTFGYSLEFHGRDAFVDELFLHERFRGRGLGGQVLEFLASVCVESGVKALHLEVERKNAAAQRAYEKFGFAGHDRFLMTKWVE